MYCPVAILISFTHSLSYSFARVCRLRWRINFELYFVIAIISVAAVLAIKHYLPIVKAAQLTHAMGWEFTRPRIDTVTYYAIHGYWPKNKLALKSIGGYEDDPKIQDPYIPEAIVDNGAIHLHFSNKLAGEVLTIRPALPSGSFDSVIWVCGNHRDKRQWTVVGEDKTTFDNRYIIRQLW